MQTAAHSTNAPAKDLFLEISEDLEKISVSPLTDPDGKLDDSDTEVGVLKDERIRRIFRLSVTITSAMEDLADDEQRIIATLGPKVRAMGSPPMDIALKMPEFAKEAEELETTRTKYFSLKAKHDVVSELFWSSVKLEFPKELLQASSIGIRRGWKVVKPLSPEDRVIAVLSSMGKHFHHH